MIEVAPGQDQGAHQDAEAGEVAARAESGHPLHATPSPADCQQGRAAEMGRVADNG